MPVFLSSVFKIFLLSVDFGFFPYFNIIYIFKL